MKTKEYGKINRKITRCSSKIEQRQDTTQRKPVAVEKISKKRQALYQWLMPSGEGAFCSVCVKFYTDRPLPACHSGIFVTKPFSLWQKTTGTDPQRNELLTHLLSKGRRSATSFENEESKMQQVQKSVYGMVHKQSLDQLKTNLDRLTDFADCAYYLFRNKIPHTTNNKSILELAARFDGSGNIKQFIDSTPDSATYTSTTTVTEFLSATSDWVTDGLIKEMRSSQYISILAEESTDLRTRNELKFLLKRKTGTVDEICKQLQISGCRRLISPAAEAGRYYACLPYWNCKKLVSEARYADGNLQDQNQTIFSQLERNQNREVPMCGNLVKWSIASSQKQKGETDSSQETQEIKRSYPDIS
ncbi:hypothetical protein Btru_048665 [Bulinus truncatus]|nr:hypothetical protein Btru_048665 [Bulinus truncatus]